MNICGVDLAFTLDGFQMIYSAVACIMWICSLLFSFEYMKSYEHRGRYYIFMIATWFATVGVLASTNLLTTFIFFEIMSFTSYLLVIHEETPAAMRAGETYLAVAVIGGMVMLMGLFLLYNGIGTLAIGELEEASKAALAAGTVTKGRIYAAGICILFGFGAKAGIVPLHIWLPKAHPIAPAPASALLSGILTKAGIFGAIAVSVNLFFEDQSWGFAIASLGLLTMLLGAVLGVFSVNLKRTLACSSVSQIGFITMGIGMICLLGEENALASNGTILHMINHSMIKLLLFSAAGVVYMNIHQLDLTKIKGFGRKKPLLLVLFLIGAASISGIPGTSGYISKTLLHESMVEYMEAAEAEGMTSMAHLFSVYEWVFLITGGLTLCYMTKLFICLFVESNEDKALQKKYDEMKHYMNPLSALCLLVPAVILTVMGVTPHWSMEGLAAIARPFMHGFASEHVVQYFAFGNLKGGLISIAIGVLVYVFIVRRFFIKKGQYVNLWPEKLDLENLLYRPLIAALLKPGIIGLIDRIPEAVAGFVLHTLFSKFGRERKGTNLGAWLHKCIDAEAFRYVRAAYIELRESMSYGLLVSAAGLTIFLLYVIIRL